MNLEEIKMQAIQYYDGPYRKGITFVEWADSKDFSERDRELIWEWVCKFIS